MLKLSIINKALKEANLSTHQYKIGAVIFKKKTIISSGRNYRIKSVRSITNEFVKFKGSVHAEVAAIINAKTDLKGCSIFVLRTNNSGSFLCARPCNYCMGYLKHVGIKKVYYINREGEIEVERV